MSTTTSEHENETPTTKDGTMTNEKTTDADARVAELQRRAKEWAKERRGESLAELDRRHTEARAVATGALTWD